MDKVILSGRICKDIELKYTATSNTAVTKFSLAVDNPYSKDETKKATFITIQAWGKTAEFIGKWLGKGRKIIVEGRIDTNTWDDPEGKKHYETLVVAEKVEFADSKKSDAQAEGQQAEPGEYQLEDDDLPF